MPYVRILGFVTLFLAFIAGLASAGAAGITPPDQAFRFRTEWTDKGGVRVGWSIAPGRRAFLSSNFGDHGLADWHRHVASGTRATDVRGCLAAPDK